MYCRPRMWVVGRDVGWFDPWYDETRPQDSKRGMPLG
jgi:hypothetical protein